MDNDETSTQQVKKSPNLFGRSLNLKMFTNNSGGSQSPFPFSRKNKANHKKLPTDVSSPKMGSQDVNLEKAKKKSFKLAFGFPGNRSQSRSDGSHICAETNSPEDAKALEDESGFPGNCRSNHDRNKDVENSPNIADDKGNKRNVINFLTIGWNKSKRNSSSASDILVKTFEEDVLAKKESKLSVSSCSNDRDQIGLALFSCTNDTATSFGYSSKREDLQKEMCLKPAVKTISNDSKLSEGYIVMRPNNEKSEICEGTQCEQVYDFADRYHPSIK